MGRLIGRLVFTGVGVVLLAQSSVGAEDATASSAVEEPKVSVAVESPVEEKPSDAASSPIVVEMPRPLFQHSTYPAAWKAAQRSNRPILVYVCMPNCHYCVKMKQQVYQLPRVKDMVSSSFETIKADRFAHPKLISSLKVRLYPTTVLVSPNNKILDVIEGYSDPAKFQQRLQTGLASLTPPTVKKIAAR